MIRRMADFFTRLMERYLPDAFVFAVILTLVVFVAGVFGQEKTPMQMAVYWGDGLWNLLAFSMQMALILVTGYVLAMAPVVQRMLRRLAAQTATMPRAVVVTTVVALVASWFNWGFGLVASALIAREIARQHREMHYPLLVASAYSGFLVWHAGLSGSIPLKVASPGNDVLGKLLPSPIPVSETILSGPVIWTVVILAISLPILNWWMTPHRSRWVNHVHGDDSSPVETHPKTPAEKIEHSRWILWPMVIMAMAWLVHHFERGGGLSLNVIILIFLVLGLALHGKPANYLRAFQQAVGITSGIVLQFPLYAGLMGMMIQSGLASSVSQWFVDIASPETFPVLTFLSAGLVNVFVPSGGGQWAVQAPIVIPAAQALGVPLNQAAMAVAFGDAWTNMIQPFWALPLLAVSGLSVRHIMGYCTVVLLWSGLVIMVGLSFFY